MRIILISQYFWPESFIINDLVTRLVSQGHEVLVATGKPNYPEGNIYPGYTAKGVHYERYKDLVDVVRVPLYPRGSGGAMNLVLNYLSFVFFGLWHLPRMLRGKRFDAILVFAPSPITQVIPAIFLKWLKRAHLAVWVQDLWPESLAATGFVRNPWILRFVGYMVRGIYSCCDTLLLQSRAFFQPVARYAALEKMVYFPNSIDNDHLSEPEAIPDSLKAELKEKFSVVFAGNIGTAQSMESIVAAVNLLKSNLDLKFFVVGSGSMLDWVRQQKSLLELDNLILPGRFPMSMMPEIFKHSAALLVSLKDEEIFSYTIPSKVQAYLASGRPIIAALRGEGARVVLESGAGYVCEPENGEALARAIKEMMSCSQEERQVMGKSGLNYFNLNFDMSRQAERLIKILKTRIGDP